MKCEFVWLISKMGCTWSAHQLRIKVPKGFDEYAFQDDSDEDAANSLNTQNFVDSSDEEDGVARPAQRSEV